MVDKIGFFGGTQPGSGEELGEWRRGAKDAV